MAAKMKKSAGSKNAMAKKGVKALKAKKPAGKGVGEKPSKGKGAIARAKAKVKLANYKF